MSAKFNKQISLLLIALFLIASGANLKHAKYITTAGLDSSANEQKNADSTFAYTNPAQKYTSEQVLFETAVNSGKNDASLQIEPGIRALMENPYQDISELTSANSSYNPSNYETNDSSNTLDSYLYFGGDSIVSPGNPLYDAFGHGLGMSQWGAYGAANNGWTAEQILTHYYKDTHIAKLPGPIMVTVEGHSTMNIEGYVAGLGEVPSKACGTQQLIDAWEAMADDMGWAEDDPKRNKYVIDNPNSVWDCWPEESIKAQVTAARSYAYTSPQPICTTPACQVYAGGYAKQWAAWETRRDYIVSNGYTHNGQVIRAFYSSYNSNGWGSADHATIWGDRNGNTTSYSYLRAAYDANVTHVAYGRTPWYNTKIYSLGDLDQMIDWCSTPGNCDTHEWLDQNVENIIGNLTAITFIKDDSGRVKKVTLMGTNGSASTSGAYFRSVFNKWATIVKPKGVEDSIPAITFTAYSAFSPPEQAMINQIKTDIDNRILGQNDHNQMEVTAFVEKVWPDSCLGIPTEYYCNSLNVAGFRVDILYNSQTWVYRTQGTDWFVFYKIR